MTPPKATRPETRSPRAPARGVIKRYQHEGHLHVITVSTHRRAPILPPYVPTFEHSLEQTRRRYSLDIHGFVLMPEHVHPLLSEPTTEPSPKPSRPANPALHAPVRRTATEAPVA